MSLFIQLVIVSVVALMVQAVPVTRNANCGTSKDQSKTADVRKLEHLYCVTRSLNEIVRPLAPNKAVNVPEINMSTETMTKVFEEFSDRCRNYTQAMSLKHWLQDYLLNDNVKSDQIESYSSMLVSLQTVTNILDDVEFIQHKKHCVTLTAVHYKKIHHVQYDNTSVLDVLLAETKNWMRAIKREIAPPTQHICKNIDPTL